MLRLFHPQIAALLQHRDQVIDAWAAARRGIDVLEERSLEVTGFLRISVAAQVAAVRRALRDTEGIEGYKSPGRPKDSPSKTTAEMRQAWLEAFHEVQQRPNASLQEWALRLDAKGNFVNLDKFYQLSLRLIPQEVKAELSGTLGVYEAIQVPVQPREEDPGWAEAVQLQQREQR